jgi:hypothetical protein
LVRGSGLWSEEKRRAYRAARLKAREAARGELRQRWTDEDAAARADERTRIDTYAKAGIVRLIPGDLVKIDSKLDATRAAYIAEALKLDRPALLVESENLLKAIGALSVTVSSCRQASHDQHGTAATLASCCSPTPQRRIRPLRKSVIMNGRAGTAIRWVEIYCVYPSGRARGKKVKLTPEERRLICRIYDCLDDKLLVTGPLAAYLALRHTCGREALQTPQFRPNIHTDIFTVWAATSPALREILRRDGGSIVCPALGTRFPAIAA